MMYKSTIILGVLCGLLSISLGVTTWWVWQSNNTDNKPSVSGAHLDIGLAGMEGDNDESMIVSESAVLWDMSAEVMRYESSGFERRPIASLTKLMTAMVALDMKADWDKEMTIEAAEQRIGGRLVLGNNEFVTMKDLLHASLMGSANNATIAMVRGLDISEEEFVREMNRKVIELGLEQTEFVDMTGLDVDNVSTAYEVARMAEEAFVNYPLIAEITSKIKYVYQVGGSGREHTLVNTNNMITEWDYELSGSKTGYLYEASFCLVVKGSNKFNDRIVVVLGAPSEWDSMQDVQTLLEMP